MTRCTVPFVLLSAAGLIFYLTTLGALSQPSNNVPVMEKPQMVYLCDIVVTDGEPIKLPENLESLPRADHFPTQRHRWNTNEVSLIMCTFIVIVLTYRQFGNTSLLCSKIGVYRNWNPDEIGFLRGFRYSTFQLR